MKQFDVSAINLAAPLQYTERNLIIAVQPGIFLYAVSTQSDLYGCYDMQMLDRPYLHVALGIDNNVAGTIEARTQVALISLDYWEY